MKYLVPLSFRAKMSPCFFVQLFTLLFVKVFIWHLVYIHYVPGTVVIKNMKNLQCLQTCNTLGWCTDKIPFNPTENWKFVHPSVPSFIHSPFIHSFTLQIFIEHLLCATPCPRCWGCGIEQARPSPSLCDASIPVGRWDATNKHINSCQRLQRKVKQARCPDVGPVTSSYGEIPKRDPQTPG